MKEGKYLSDLSIPLYEINLNCKWRNVIRLIDSMGNIVDMKKWNLKHLIRVKILFRLDMRLFQKSSTHWKTRSQIKTWALMWENVEKEQVSFWLVFTSSFLIGTCCCDDDKREISVRVNVKCQLYFGRQSRCWNCECSFVNFIRWLRNNDIFLQIPCDFCHIARQPVISIHWRSHWARLLFRH